MKNKLITLLMLCLPLAAMSQPSSYISFYHHYLSSDSANPAYPTGSNYLAIGGLSDGLATITWQSASNAWVVSGLSSGGEWTTNSIQYPTNGQLYILYGSSGPLLDSVSANCYLQFFNFAPLSAMPVVTTALTNFLPVAGGSGKFSARGVSGSNNAVVLLLNSNLVFESAPTTLSNSLWQLSGQFQFDGTNKVDIGVQLTGSGADSSGFLTITNFIGTNFSLAFGVDSNLDTFHLGRMPEDFASSTIRNPPLRRYSAILWASSFDRVT